MLLVLTEFTALNQTAAGSNLDRSAVSRFPPLHEGAIAESNRALSVDLRNLVARTPESAVTDANHSFVCQSDLYHRGIVAMERRKFAIRDKKPVRRGLLNQNGAIAVIGSYAKKVPVTPAGRCFYEFVTDVVTKAECVQHIFPIGAAKDKCLPVLCLPLIDPGVRTPPRVEMNILDAPDIENSIHPDTATKRLPGDIAYVMALVLACIDPLIRIQQLDIEDRRILAAHRDRPRIRDGFAVKLLFRIVNSQTT